MTMTTIGYCDVRVAEALREFNSSEDGLSTTVISSALITIAIIELPVFKNIFEFAPIEPPEFLVLVMMSSAFLKAGKRTSVLRTKMKIRNMN